MLYSVIIPVYNIEKHLNRCIESVLLQTEKDFELILVDDGSTDESGSICDYYADIDSRVKVMHKANAGVSAARNAGLRAATAEYIVFIDSDDFIEKTYLESMTGFEDDLIAVGFDDYEEDGTISKRFDFADSHVELVKDEDIIAYCKEPGWLFVWAKRYKRSIINCHSIVFDESLKIYEDIIFNLQYIKVISCVHLLDKGGYHHCQYSGQTLSTGKDDLPLSQRMVWREKAIDLFDGHPFYQKHCANEFLYFAECEIIRISNLQCTTKITKKMLADLIDSSLFWKACAICKDYWNPQMRALIRLKCYQLIALRYRA